MPRPSPFHALLHAFRKGQDIAPFLEAIDWDAPVFAWQDQAPAAQSRRAHLDHPLCRVFALGDPGLSAAVVARLEGHPWSQVRINQVQRRPTTSMTLALPPLSDFSEWGVLQAALQAGAWQAACRIMPRVAHDSRRHPHPVQAALVACKAIGQIREPGPALEVWAAAQAAWPDPRTQAFLRAQVVEEASRTPNPDLALALVEQDPGLAVRVIDLLNLAMANQQGHVLRLLDMARERGQDFRDDPDLGTWLAGLTDQIRHDEPARPQNLELAGWLLEHLPPVRELLTDPATPGTGKAFTLAAAVANLVRDVPPHRLERLRRQSRGVARGVLRAWALNPQASPTHPALAPWLDVLSRVAGPDRRQDLFSEVLAAMLDPESPWSLTLSHSGPGNQHSALALAAYVERLDEWAQALGLQLETALAGAAPEPQRCLSDLAARPGWAAAMASHRARKMEQSLAAPAATERSKARL